MSPIQNLDDVGLDALLGRPVGGWSAADLRLAREGLGLTQEQLADAIGYERSGIAKLEGGATPPRLVVELAVRYLVEQRPQGQRFQPKASPSIARFRPSGEALGINESGFPIAKSVEVHLAEGPAIWLRLMPAYGGQQISTVNIKKAATQQGFLLEQLMDGYTDLGFVRAGDGFGVFGMIGGDRSTTRAVSFMFSSGEIWAIDTYMIDAVKRHANDARQPRPGMPYLEDRFKAATHSFLSLLGRLGFRPPFRWIAGIEGIKDMGLFFPAPSGQFFAVPFPQGQCVVDTIWDMGTLELVDTPASALRPFFRKMFDAFGIDRPEYLDNVANPR